MPYIKPIWLFNLSLCLLAAPALYAQTQLTACLEQGKKEFLEQEQKALPSRNYESARKTFERCLKMDPDNEDTLLSLGAVALTQEKLDAARDYFQRALAHMARTSPYFSYSYSMLGDISFKRQQYAQALGYYERSLQYNKANVNSLVGKGLILEIQGKKKAAAEVYKVALAVEPLNIRARQQLIALEPVYFTDEEMLDALKQRYAALPEKTQLSEADRDLFVKIHDAEQRGGIDYLKSKYKTLPSDYVVTLFKDTGFAREVLTVSGYNALRKQVGQDAVGVFQKAGVPVKDVFDLRDNKGQKIFLPDSTLTDSGFYVYNEALRGRRAFLLPGEEVPPSQADLEKIAARMAELEKNGYTEISRKELVVVQQATNCSEDTMRQHMGLYVLKVSAKDKRYFVPYGQTADPHKGVPYHYVARYRAQQNPAVRVPKNSLVEMYESFGENYKLCSAVDGTLLVI